ncbi:hypothetical protein RDWZM_004150 [Blomia tropicalis]|uniref:Uncharacterized protein n=1 Tax=Blomia tropicalis TaxID=40697 RepID=A0A9Q0MKN1_BLOTA|nr:hypothetical protein RDWZM_004150 [Blomia tropicalis]
MNDDNNDDYMVSAKALRKLLETTFEYENKRNEKFDHSYFEYLFSKDKTLKGLKFSKYLMFDEKGDIMRAVGSLRFVYNLIINEVNRRQKVETLKEAAKYLDNVDMKELEAEMPNMIGLSSKQMNWMFPLERKSEKPEKKPFPVNTKLETKKAKKDKKPKKSLYKIMESLSETNNSSDVHEVMKSSSPETDKIITTVPKGKIENNTQEDSNNNKPFRKETLMALRGLSLKLKNLTSKEFKNKQQDSFETFNYMEDINDCLPVRNMKRCFTQVDSMIDSIDQQSCQDKHFTSEYLVSILEESKRHIMKLQNFCEIDEIDQCNTRKAFEYVARIRLFMEKINNMLIDTKTKGYFYDPDTIMFGINSALMPTPKIINSHDLNNWYQLLHNAEIAKRFLINRNLSTKFDFEKICVVILLAKLAPKFTDVFFDTENGDWKFDSFIKFCQDNIMVIKNRKWTETGFDEIKFTDELCVFCRKDYHCPEHCEVNEWEKRRELLRNEHRCIRCFSNAHLSQVCHLTCSFCNGEHHIALCFKYRPKDQNHKSAQQNSSAASTLACKLAVNSSVTEKTNEKVY